MLIDFWQMSLHEYLPYSMSFCIFIHTLQHDLHGQSLLISRIEAHTGTIGQISCKFGEIQEISGNSVGYREDKMAAMASNGLGSHGS
jgi:hypothetical protein